MARGPPLPHTCVASRYGVDVARASRILVIAFLIRPVLAQAPANDIISWPSGLLLLASVLYAALGRDSDYLWGVDPSIGISLGSGLPIFSFRAMKRVVWISNACHFVSNIRTAHGRSNSWIRSEEITTNARTEATKTVSAALHCVTYGPLTGTLDGQLWGLTDRGLLAPVAWPAMTPSASSIDPGGPFAPTAHDFLLFAATDYHISRGREVNVYRGPDRLFSTRGLLPFSLIDVDSEERALAVVAANMVRRPFSQTRLRARATPEGASNNGPLKVDLLGVDPDTPICAIDFHSYSAPSAKVSASLNELARAYYRVVSHVKENAVAFGANDINKMAKVDVGQSLWSAILGGALLDQGRLTIQNLPGHWSIQGISADEAYLKRVQVVLEAIEHYANTPRFTDVVFSGGASRPGPTYAFLLAGLFGQMVICYFLSVGTSAGVWTSVTIANSLFMGKLTDMHTMNFGRTARTSEPGMKMYAPDAPDKSIMAVATFDRSSPRTPWGLTPGVLLNLCGLAAAIFGAAFQRQTRHALGFGPLIPTPHWVIYTSILASLGTTLLIVVLIVGQQLAERTWNDSGQWPIRWVIYCTTLTSVIVCVLAAFCARCRLAHLWPILDSLTWLSGVPLGMIENGRVFNMDDNVLHLILVNRWMLGAVSSSLGSSAGGSGGGKCWR